MKALASDFDGTLYFWRADPPFRMADLKKIKEFQAEGNLFGICTGRSQDGILIPVGDRIHFDFYILASGALILDGERNVIYKECVDKSIAQKLCDAYQDTTKVIFQANDTLYAFEAFFPEMSVIDSLDDIPGDGVYGVSLEAANEGVASVICAAINAEFGDILKAFQNIRNIDIVSKNCSKGKGISFVKTYFHVDEMAGIGDSFNDVPMLEQADHAFTFHASPVSVQEKAGHLVDSVGEAITILERL